MSISLYRKHRPQKFGDISGQRHIITTLQHQLEMDRVAHAYLFAGPRGTGKTTTSRILAKAVNCTRRVTKTFEPCNECLACVSITNGNALDVLEIDAASHTGVDHVREHIISSSLVTPTCLRRKVFIIDEVHMLSPQAFNALLKTLEEPPGNVLFILATTEVGKLPATIVSRCQRFDFKKISAADIAERLAHVVASEGHRVGDGVLEAIAANADGSVRDAESMLEQVLTLGDDPITLDQAKLVIPYTDLAAVLEFVGYLANRQAVPALEQVNRMSADGVDLLHFAGKVTGWLRQLLLLKSGTRLPDLSAALTPAQSEQLVNTAERFTIPGLVNVLTRWIARTIELKFTEIPQLPLELAVVEICFPHNSSGSFTSTETSPVPAPIPKAKDETTVRKSPKLPKAAEAAAEKAAVSNRDILAEKSSAGKKGEPKPAAVPPVKLPAVSFEQVRERWEELLAQVKTKNFSLFSILRVTQPMEMAGDVLRISVAYDFHVQRVAEPKNRRMVEQALEEIFLTPLRIEVVVMENASRPEYAHEDNALQSLLENFGGKLLE